MILQMEIDCLSDFHDTPPAVGVQGVSALINYTSGGGSNDRGRDLPGQE